MNPDDLAFLEINLFPGMQSDTSRVSHSEAQPINEFTELRTRWLNYFGTMTAASKMQVKRNIKKSIKKFYTNNKGRFSKSTEFNHKFSLMVGDTPIPLFQLREFHPSTII